MRYTIHWLNDFEAVFSLKRSFCSLLLLSFCLLASCTQSEHPKTHLSSYCREFSIPSKTYVILNDIDLKGDSLVLPNDVRLIFKGGKISNGKVYFDNTRLSGKVIFRDIDIYGVLANDTVYTSWFFQKGILHQKDINALVSSINYCTIKFDADYTLKSDREFTGEATHNKYYYDGINIKSEITYDGCGHTLYSGTADNIFNCIYDFSVNDHTPRVNWRIMNFILARDQKDVGKKQTEATSINIRNAINGIINNCVFKRWKGQAIHISLLPLFGKEYHSRNLIISDCDFYGTLRKSEKYNAGNGINVISGSNVHITRCKFFNIKTDTLTAGKWPGAIDIETEEFHSNVSDIFIDSCYISNCGWLAPVSFSSKLDSKGKILPGYGGGDGHVYINNLIVNGCEFAINVQNGRPCGYVHIENANISDAEKLFYINNTSTSVLVVNSIISSKKIAPLKKTKYLSVKNSKIIQL